VKQPSVSGWEKGEAKPTAANFIALAEMAPEGDLRDYFHSMAERVSGVKIDRGDQPSGRRDRSRSPKEGFARVPLLKDSAAAGSPRQLDEKRSRATSSFPRRGARSRRTAWRSA
jgi:hypothetical protein